jgi:hypothetical protein
VTTQVNLSDSVRNEVRKITEHKAFYAAAGAGDFAVEKLRTLPEMVARLQEDVPKQITRLQTLPGELSRVQDTIRYRLGDQGQSDLAALSGRAVEYMTNVSARAVQAYDDLAERGKNVAGRAAGLDPQQVATETAADIEAAARSAARSALRTANRTVDAARETALSRAPMIARPRLGNGKAGPATGTKDQAGAKAPGNAGSGASASRGGSASTSSASGKTSSGGTGRSTAGRGSGAASRSSSGSTGSSSSGGSTARNAAGSKSRQGSQHRQNG